jgi:hypothetical protein
MKYLTDAGKLWGTFLMALGLATLIIGGACRLLAWLS